MVSPELLEDLLQNAELSRSDKILLCLGVEPSTPRQVKEIKQVARSAGLRAAERWNISAILGSSGGRAIRTDAGWKLNQDGRKYVSSIVGVSPASPPAPAANLRAHLTQLQDSNTREFVEQAIACFEYKLYRAAVVLSWVGAVSLLDHHVKANHVAAFNKEATRRNAKWKSAKTTDDLARMNENDFLEILEALSLIGKSVKQELQGCLKLRNGCGHPNSLKVGEARAAAHVESLTLNVFAVFAGAT